MAPVVAIAEVKAILKTMGDQYTGANALNKHHDDHDLHTEDAHGHH
jgi:hypothetical protein